MLTTEFYKITSQQAAATLLAGGLQDNGTEISFGNRTWYQPGGCDGNNVAVDAANSDTLYGTCNGSLKVFPNPLVGTTDGLSLASVSSPAAMPVPPLITDSGVAG